MASGIRSGTVPRTSVGSRLRAVVRTPARRLAARRTTWAYGMVRLRLARHGAGKTLAWACRPTRGPAVDPDAAWWSAQSLVRRGRLPGNCLVRSVVLARVLASGGRRPSIRLGVRREGAGIRAHAWVEMDGRTYGEDDGFHRLGRVGDRVRPGGHKDHR
jgi:hypothetical protein